LRKPKRRKVMAYQARVLYDFQAVSPGELAVNEGDVVTVTDPDVGQGWCQATGPSGTVGVVPEAYIEKIGDVVGGGGGVLTQSQTISQSSSGWDDEDRWSSEDEHNYEDPAELGVQPKGPGITYADPQLSRVKTSKDPVAPPPRPAGKPTNYTFSLGKMAGGWGKSAAVTDYVTGMTDSAATLGSHAVLVTEASQGGYQWQGKFGPYTCTIGTAKKSSKLGGIKQFIAYQVTPSYSNIQVSRRYKHFDWLYHVLVKKFGGVIAIPPLPEKQVAGRFDEDLIEHRRIELQSFTDRICRHPVLAGSEVWKHFVSETDEKKWTKGKRSAESDPLVGTAFLTTVQAPSILVNTELAIDEDIGVFSKELAKLETAVKTMHSVANDQAAKYRGDMKKDCRDIGKGFKQLGAATGGRVNCLEKIGAAYEDLGSDWESQATRDWEPMVHTMHDYRGLSEGWDKILGFYSSVREKGKEIIDQGGEKEKDAAVARVNTYRVGVAAELGFFRQEMAADFNYGCQSFLVEQIKFHRQMADKLEALYRNCWDGEGGESMPPPPPQAATAPSTLPTSARDPLAAWGDSSETYEEMP